MEATRQRVIAILEMHPGTPLCGPCVALEISATRRMVNEVIRDLLSPTQVRFYALTRERARCRSCGLRRFTIYFPARSLTLD